MFPFRGQTIELSSFLQKNEREQTRTNAEEHAYQLPISYQNKPGAGRRLLDRRAPTIYPQPQQETSGVPNLDFRWKQITNGWQLDPPPIVTQAGDTAITVRFDGRFWQIYLGDAPLMPGNWTSEIGAKSDGWQHAMRHALEYYGTKKIRLIAQ